MNPFKRGLPLLVCVASAAHLHAQTAKGMGFTFDYAADVFHGMKFERVNRLTAQENGEEMPFDIAPSHLKCTLQEEPPIFMKHEKTDPQIEAWLEIIPLQDPSVPDFKKAYPDLVDGAAELKKILKSGIGHPSFGSTLPEWNLVDAAQTIHSQAQILEGPWCSGIQYLTEEAQDNTPISNDGLIYVFQGLSHDGAYYVAFEAQVSHPALSGEGPDLDKLTDAQQNAYYAGVESQLNAAEPESFSPSLMDLASMVLSIRPSER